ncbi:hypothetical protein GOP47_0015447 [Adiantum capillus-veneris]|uniref:TBC1 domain family member 15 n=1 Tax=Adiantum capillus-veneris TaxID=13818 RepID=A0A9D4ZDZ7_ADICA|nr:hypothetical protein GOP47_0015447 [Adiantum capillus-veneris]
MEDQEVLYVKDNVAVHPTQNAHQRINGRLCILKEGHSVFMTWIPYVQRSTNKETPDSTTNDRLLYTIRGLPLTQIRSIRRNTPHMGWQYIIIVLTSGLAFPPLYFHNGGIKEFLVTLKEHVHMVRSVDDANLFLVNDIGQDPLQKSLTSLELRDVVSTAALPSRDQHVSEAFTNGHQKAMEPSPLEVAEQQNEDKKPVTERNQQRRPRDPARDVSIQVLEKFSLVTKFARDTTAQLFGENRLLGSNDDLKDLDRSYRTRRQEDRRLNVKGGTVSQPVEHQKEIAMSMPAGNSDLDTSCTGARLTPLGSEEFVNYFDQEGRIPLSHALRKRIFYGGIVPGLRCKAWKFLLGHFSFDSTYRQREELVVKKREEYMILKAQWQTITEQQAKRFAKFRERKSRIEKDVVRTDRGVEFYAEDDNPNVMVLRDILITYSFYNFDLGYCQGMSDFLSPILYVVGDESESFWCFASLMERMAPNFHRDQNGMHSQLLALSKLVQLLDFPLHTYLKEADCLNYFFCFRWLLIQFKREFPYEDVMRLWEVLWTNHLTEHLHLYICVALLKAHKKKIIEEEMDFDTLLKFINELSGHIDLEVALRDAEALFLIAGDVGAACIPPGTPPSLQVACNEDLISSF